MMLSSHAVQHLTECSSHLIQAGSIEVENKAMIDRQHQENDDNGNIVWTGQYEINVSQAVIDDMQIEHMVRVVWLTENTDKNKNQKYLLSKDLVWYLHQKLTHSEEEITIHNSHCNIIVI